MGVCRRIVKEFQPSELTICVTIYSERRAPPKFTQWSIERPGCPPRIIPCSTTSSEFLPRRQHRRNKKKEETSSKNLEKSLSSSSTSTMIADDVFENSEDVKKDSEDVKTHRERHISITSLESVPGLGGVSSNADDSEGVVKKSEDVTTPTQKFKKFDILSNGDVMAMKLVEKSNSSESIGKKKVLVKKKKKSKTPESPPRYRNFTETTVNMYVEMNKQNVGEFVWDQQCTRIDALVAPIIELDRTNTPEIPVEIDVFD